MNHRKSVKKIGKDRKHKKAILRNISLSFLKYETIKTTVSKAKIFRSFIEKIITRAKKDTLHNRRLIFRDIKDTKLLKKLFKDIAIRYQNRKGGYLRLIRIGQRKGDAANMCYVSFVKDQIDSGSRVMNSTQSNDKKSVTNLVSKQNNPTILKKFQKKPLIE